MTIVKLTSVASTNKYCEVLDLSQVEDFTCFWALEQTAGIGQRGNHWHSEPGKNLTFSLVLHPTFLPANQQFKLTQTLSLALCDLLSPFTSHLSPFTSHLSPSTSHLSPFTSHLSPSIKWPNDIYVANRKICGTLISTRLTGDVIASAICGIGLNVNQTTFPDWVPNPTSLKLLTSQDYDLESLLQRLLQCIQARYEALRRGIDMQQEYLGHLMNLGVPARYLYQGNEIEATITGVDSHGRLLLTAADGRRLSCGMKEITFLG